MSETTETRPHDPLHYVVAIQMQARERNMLSMWTVYDHPTDMPDVFVARCFCVGGGEEPRPTENYITSSTLGALRMILRMAGLSCLARNDEDDPKIVETWL